MTHSLARRSWCTLGLLTSLLLGGCRCDSSKPAKGPAVGWAVKGAGASQPASSPASQASSGPTSKPVDTAALAALRAKQLKAIDDIAAGRGDLGAFYRGLPAYRAAVVATGFTPEPEPADQLQHAVRENLEFLIACRALQAKNPAKCSEAAPLGKMSVTGCQRMLSVHGLFRTMLVEKKCAAAALAPAAKTIGVSAGELVALCEGTTRSDPARCADTAKDARAVCEAVAAKDESKCQAAGPGRGECEKNFKLMRALLTGDRKGLPRELGMMAAFANLLYEQPPSCETPFLSDMRRYFGAPSN